MANKHGRNKKKCEKYRMSGHREENKKRKQEKHVKLMQRFAERREAGKNYRYDHASVLWKLVDAGFNLNSKTFNENKDVIYQEFFAPNKGSNRAMHTEYARNKSVFRKLDNELNKKKEEMKKANENKKIKRGK